MSEVQPDSPQGIYDTLLELRLQNWAHEEDPQVRPGRAIRGVEKKTALSFLPWLPLAARFRSITPHPEGLNGSP